MAGVNVVGRTRYCIYPKESVKNLTVVGGTKDINWQKVQELAPDLLLLDREENPLEIFAAAVCATHVTHVRDIKDVASELTRLSQVLESSSLDEFAARWRGVLGGEFRNRLVADFPGVVEWWRAPTKPITIGEAKVCYVIWRDPWMAITQRTFIGSMLARVGVQRESIWPKAKGDRLYPEFHLSEIPEGAVVLFSTEPFPFAKYKQKLVNMPELSGHPLALINGESFSWFGLRALEFLESQNKTDGKNHKTELV